MIITCISIYIIFNANKIISNNLALTALTNKIENDPNEVRSKFYATAILQGTVGTLGFGRGLGESTKLIDGSSYHHYMLEILAEFGLWILLAYLTLIFKICIQLWRSIQKGNNVFWSSGILASCIAFPLLCSGPASLTYIYPYWLWLAFIIVYTDINTEVKTVSDK
jgi:hypothetical protein